MTKKKPHTSRIRKPLDTIPSELVSPSDYERIAPGFIEAATYAHISGGSGAEQTLRANVEGLNSIEIYNRVLKSFAEASTRTVLFGQTFRHPVLMAPVASQALVHVEGELATAAGAAAQQACLVLSTQASMRLEDVAVKTDSPKWFQLYIQHDRDYNRALLERAEDAGYSAIVVTLDAPVQTPGYDAARSGFVLPAHAQAINLDKLPAKPPVYLQPGQSVIFQGMMSDAPDWTDLEWLQRQTSLPIIAKGVSHPHDAMRLADSGIHAIAVSNHGGRALDGMPASIDMLPGIREAVGPEYPLLFDGGVRSGYDVFKAIAMGADAVMIGRLQIYALAVAGSQGVAHLIKMICDELELAMALTGCAAIAEIDKGCLFNKDRKNLTGNR